MQLQKSHRKIKVLSISFTAPVNQVVWLKKEQTNRVIIMNVLLEKLLSRRTYFPDMDAVINSS